MRGASRPLGEASLDVLDTLWTRGPLTAADVADDTGRDVRSTLSNLKYSGFVERTGDAKGGEWALTVKGFLHLEGGR